MRPRVLQSLLCAIALVAACLIVPSLAFGVGESGPGSSVDGTLRDTVRNGVILGCEYCHTPPGGTTNRQGPHGGYTATTDRCFVCHGVHEPRSNSDALMIRTTATDLCLACHDGTGGYGVYGTIKARTGVEPGAAHRAVVPVTKTVPAGDPATGGSRVETGFAGVNGNLSCIDCHSAHGSNVVQPFATERPRLAKDWTDRASVMSTALLKQKPNGSDTTTTVYGSDWCGGCHRAAHARDTSTSRQHPVDSKISNPASFYSYDNVPVDPWLGVMDIATDSGGNVYVVDPGNRRVEKFTSAGAYVTQWNVGASGQLQDPRGIAITGASVWVGDPRGGYVSRYTTAGVFQSSFGTAGNKYSDNAGGTFQTPAGLGSDAAGTLLYVADTEHQTVSVRNATTSAHVRMMERQWFPGTWPGTGVADMYEPTDVAADSAGNVYVVDSMNHRIKKYDPNGNRLLIFGSRGTGNGQFERPLSIAIDSANRIWVADAGNHRIQRFDTAGVFQQSVGSLGTADGQFRLPRGVTVDSAGNVYVVDSGNDRVEKFTAAGTYTAKWGTRGAGNGQFTFSAETTGSLGPWARGANGNPNYSGRGFLMQYPRTSLQQGHGPICQQCHEDSRYTGDLYDGLPLPAGPEMIPDGVQNEAWWTDGGTGQAGPRDVGNPRFTNFPHESVNATFLVETEDKLCADCHPQNPLVLP